MKYDRNTNCVMADRETIEEFMEKHPNSGLEKVYTVKFHMVAFMGLAVGKVEMFGQSRHIMGSRAMKGITAETVTAFSRQAENFVKTDTLAAFRR